MDEMMRALETKYNTQGNRMFYLAMAPEYFGVIANNLKKHGMKDSPGWTRLMIEKPFGHNLTSARELNNEIRTAFDENQIYRSEEHTSELQSRFDLVCRLLLEKKNKKKEIKKVNKTI